MSGAKSAGLQVVLTGVDAPIARDVARLLTTEGASVIAADGDTAALASLDRDLGLFRTPVETVSVDLANAVELRLWESSLRAFDRLPHLLICCCRCGGPPALRSERHSHGVEAIDFALCEADRPHCPAEVAQQVLQPALFLHAEPMRRSVFNRALAALRHPTLRGVLERAPGRGVFSPKAVIPYVRIASHLYSVSRQIDGEPARLGRIRLRAPGRPAPRRADAA